MKPLKSFFVTSIFFILFFTGFAAERADAAPCEVFLVNYSPSRLIGIHIYPISMIFNGYNEYDLHSRYFTPGYHYNSGGNFSVAPNTTVSTINHDADPTTGGNTASVGYGKYKIVVSWIGGYDTCTVEWDYGFTLAPPPFAADLSIIFRDDNNNPRVNFKWSGSIQEYPISYVNKEIVVWDQQNTEFQRRRRAKNYGNFVYDNSFGNTYNIFPQDSRRDCGGESQGFEDNRSGVITQHLTIDKDVFTPTIFELYDSPTSVTINPNVALKISSFRTVDFTEIIPYNPGDNFEMTVKYKAFLILYNTAKILIRNHNKLTLESGGYITLSGGSEIRVKPGGTFCNQGGTINGPGRIIYESGVYSYCPAKADLIISGGADISLESNAVLEIPDNTTLCFKDNNTSFTMSDNSKLLLGNNSKIVFESGSKLVSNNEETVMHSSKTFTNKETGTVDYKTLIGNLSERSADVSSEDNFKKIFSLNQNIPNPFNPATKINYQIPNDNFVSLKIFDVSGKEVKTLVNNFQKAGSYNVSFDGSSLSSGIYYYKMISGDFVSIKKMTLIK